MEKKTGKLKGKQPENVLKSDRDLDRRSSRHESSQMSNHEFTHEQPLHKDFAESSATNKADGMIAALSRQIS